jgi:hypothetical protein
MAEEAEAAGRSSEATAAQRAALAALQAAQAAADEHTRASARQRLATQRRLDDVYREAAFGSAQAQHRACTGSTSDSRSGFESRQPHELAKAGLAGLSEAKVLSRRRPLGSPSAAARCLRSRALASKALRAWRLLCAHRADALIRAARHAARRMARSTLHGWRRVARATAAMVAATLASRRRRAVLRAWRQHVLLQRRLLYCFLLARQASARSALGCAWQEWRAAAAAAKRDRCLDAKAADAHVIQLLRRAFSALRMHAERRKRNRGRLVAAAQARVRRRLRAWHALARAAACQRARVTIIVAKRAQGVLRRCVRGWALVLRREALHREQVAFLTGKREHARKAQCWRLWTQWQADLQLLRCVFDAASVRWEAWLQVRALTCSVMLANEAAWPVQQLQEERHAAEFSQGAMPYVPWAHAGTAQAASASAPYVDVRVENQRTSARARAPF